jgi:folate-binding protein YgfZ
MYGVRTSDVTRQTVPGTDMAASLARLDDRAIIEISGEGTLAFLQDLITADVEGLQPGDAAHGGLLTPQGKIMFDFFVLATGGGVLIDCAREQRDALLQRLMMYKLRLPLGIAARDDLSVAVAWQERPDDVPDEATCFADPRVASMGWRMIAPAAALGSVSGADGDEYRTARYRIGLADSMEIGSGELFPHEANYDQFGSVNFRKGCYVGQEVVSRMQHRGTARSRIVPVEAQAALPEPGAPVMAGSRQSGKLIGASGHHGLAVIRLDRAAAAVAAGSGLSVDGVAITMHKPDWASWPDPAGDDQGDD